MNLSRVTLTRGTHQCVLQGMIHIGPQPLYATIQRDMEALIKDGYQVFFEGVRKLPIEPPRSWNEVKIRKFFGTILELYPMAAATLGVVTQKQHLKYPEDAVNADITFSDLTRRLDENGFTCNLMLGMMEFYGIEELRQKAAKDIHRRRDFKDLIRERSKEGWRGKIAKWFFFGKAMPILCDYRNEVAVDVVRRRSDGRHIYMQYGEKHIPGLITLFTSEGWTVAQTDHLDLLAF